MKGSLSRRCRNLAAGNMARTALLGARSRPQRGSRRSRVPLTLSEALSIGLAFSKVSRASVIVVPVRVAFACDVDLRVAQIVSIHLDLEIFGSRKMSVNMHIDVRSEPFSPVPSSRPCPTQQIELERQALRPQQQASILVQNERRRGRFCSPGGIDCVRRTRRSRRTKQSQSPSSHSRLPR